MFCISMYSECINTKLHLDLRASINLQIEHFFIMVIYTGFLYVLYFQVPLRYRHETTPGLESKYKSSN